MDGKQLLERIKQASSKGNAYYNGEYAVNYGRVINISDKVDSQGNVVASGNVRDYARYGTTSHYAYVTLDLKGEKVVDHTCNCDDHKKQNKGKRRDKKVMCEHCVAVSLTYLRLAEYSDMPKLMSGYSKPTIITTETLPRNTSPAVFQLISTYSARTVATAIDEVENQAQDLDAAPASNPVELLVFLSSPHGSGSERRCDLELKIGRADAHYYIVRNITNLLTARSKGEYVKYGKLLEFTHRRSAFTKSANTVLDLIDHWTAEAKAAFDAQQRRTYRSYYYNAPEYAGPKRSMELTCSQACELLDALMGETITLVRSHYDYKSSMWKKSNENITVCAGTPQLSATITAGVRDAYDLKISPGSLFCLLGDSSSYLLGQERALRCPDDFTKGVGAALEALMPMYDSTIPIRKRDMTKFCSTVLPALMKHLDVEVSSDLDAFVPPIPDFSFEIGWDNGRIYCDARADYGDLKLGIFTPAREGQPVRDVAREMAAQRIVRTFFPSGDFPTPDYAHPVSPKPAPTYSYSYYGRGPAATPQMPQFPYFDERDDDCYYRLFAEGLAELAEIGEVMLSSRLRHITVRSAPSIRIDATVDSGLLDLELTSTDMTPDELMTYLSSYRRKQRYVRLTSGDLVRLDGSVEAVAGLADGLGVAPEDLIGGLGGIPKNRTLFVDAMLKRAEGVRFERDRAFRRIVRDFDTIVDADFTAPYDLDDVLRPYQDEGFKWLCTLGSLGFGGILADDMGLGKTLQLIAYIGYQREAGEKRPALVVCPASLVYNWRAECERFAPALDALCLTGTKAQRRELIAGAADHDLLVTSYDLLRRDIDELAECEFSCVALDEAQYVKNANTLAAKAVRRLSADVRFALTGTPIENRLLELWSIFDFLMPGMLGSADSFAQRFSAPINAGEQGAAERLRALVSPFILRRNKRDVLRDLPDKNETVVLANMEGEQGKLYRASQDKLALSLRNQLPEEFATSRIKVLAELTKLRQICCDPHLVFENYRGGSAKLDTCIELVRQAVDGGHQLLLFSQFTSMFELIEARLKKEKITWLKLTGATSKEERVRLVERFQAGKAPVFLISLKAGGVGLNLTAADVVIHYDPWWNLAAENQATDRTHRIGQTREVSVFKIIAKDTIEERIVKMQERKRDLAESVLGGEAASSTAISRDDLLALLDATQ